MTKRARGSGFVVASAILHLLLLLFPVSGQNQVEGAEPPVIFHLMEEHRDSFCRRENNHGLGQLLRSGHAAIQLC